MTLLFYGPIFYDPSGLVKLRCEIATVSSVSKSQMLKIYKYTGLFITLFLANPIS